MKLQLLGLCVFAATCVDSGVNYRRQVQDPALQELSKKEAEEQLSVLRKKDMELMYWFNEVQNCSSVGGQLELVKAQSDEVRRMIGPVKSKILEEHYRPELILEGRYREALEVTENKLQELDAIRDRVRSEVLLPHQAALLETFVFREKVMRMGGEGLMAAVLNSGRANPLGLSEMQRTQLLKLQENFRSESEVIKQKLAEAQKEFSELTEKYQELTRNELTEEQKAKLNELMGAGPVYRNNPKK